MLPKVLTILIFGLLVFNPWCRSIYSSIAVSPFYTLTPCIVKAIVIYLSIRKE